MQLPTSLPDSLPDAIASDPLWLTIWLVILGGTHVLSLGFVAYRTEDAWRFRWEPLAIVGSFLVAGMIMDYLYQQVGYVRLLGLAHLIGWAPIYGWLLYRRKTIGWLSLWGK